MVRSYRTKWKTGFGTRPRLKDSEPFFFFHELHTEVLFYNVDAEEN